MRRRLLLVLILVLLALGVSGSVFVLETTGGGANGGQTRSAAVPADSNCVRYLPEREAADLLAVDVTKTQSGFAWNEFAKFGPYDDLDCLYDTVPPTEQLVEAVFWRHADGSKTYSEVFDLLFDSVRVMNPVPIPNLGLQADEATEAGRAVLEVEVDPHTIFAVTIRTTSDDAGTNLVSAGHVILGRLLRG